MTSADAAVPVAATVARLRRLQALSGDLAAALTVDQSALAVVRNVGGLPGVVRGGLALPTGGGRELRFLTLEAAEHPAVPGDRAPWCSIDAASDLPLTHTARTGQALWFPDLDELARRYPGVADRQAGLGVRAVATVPLRARAELVGALLVGYEEPTPFDEEARAFLGAVAEQAAHALRRAAAYERQRSTAELLQRALLPDTLPHLPGLSLAARYEPSGGGADVGGDWFDVHEVPGGPPSDPRAGALSGSVLVVIGDVMGRGIAAAAVMGEVRAALRAYALLDPRPAVVLERLDDLLTHHSPPEQLVTVLLGLVSADRSTVTFASAGHPPPVLQLPGRSAMVVPLPVGPPLGLPPPRREEVSLWLGLGSRLVMCTDGVVESSSEPGEDGLRRLARLVDGLGEAAPREVCTAVLDGMSERPDGRREPVDDDRAVLVVASTVGTHVRTAAAGFPADVSAASRARRWARTVLSQWQVPADPADDALLCLSEVVTNAVIHTGTEPQVRLSLAGPVLEVTVSDEGRRGAARVVEASGSDVGGRGLTVVEALSTTWASDRTSQGTSVWFEIDLQRAG